MKQISVTIFVDTLFCAERMLLKDNCALLQDSLQFRSKKLRKIYEI